MTIITPDETENLEENLRHSMKRWLQQNITSKESEYTVRMHILNKEEQNEEAMIGAK